MDEINMFKFYLNNLSFKGISLTTAVKLGLQQQHVNKFSRKFQLDCNAFEFKTNSLEGRQKL